MTNISLNMKTIGPLVFPATSTLEVKYVNGMKEGSGKVFSTKRIILANLNFYHDRLNGLCTIFDLDGHKCKECVFLNGVHDGWGCEYKQGRVIFSGMYKNGKRYSKLECYEDDQSMFKEIRNNEIVSILHLNSNHEHDGVCYEFVKGKISLITLYENGKKIYDMNTFNNNIMNEYDEKGRLLSSGEYDGNWKDGFVRKGKYEKREYKNDKLVSIAKYEKSTLIELQIIEDCKMKWIKGNHLVYQGGYCEENGYFNKDGIGYDYINTSSFSKRLYDKGKIVQLLMSVNDDIMTEYDIDKRIVYKGEYKEPCERDGKGLLYEYSGKNMIVYLCIDGEKGTVVYNIKDDILYEYDDKYNKVYEGGYKMDNKGDISYDGKGQEYNNDQLMFSGTWINGKKTGKGSYYKNGHLFFQGEWKNDLPEGKGSLYNEKGKITYEGEWRNGYMPLTEEIWIHYATGKEYSFYSNGKIKYSGSWKNKKPHGQGSFYYSDGRTLKGDWVEGELNLGNNCWFSYCEEVSYIKHTSGIIIYIGDVEDGHPQGKGKCIYNGDIVYEGNWENGKFEYATYHYIYIQDGSIYTIKRKVSKALFGCDHNSWSTTEIHISLDQHVDTYCNISSLMQYLHYSNRKRMTIQSTQIVDRLCSEELRLTLVDLYIQPNVGNDVRDHMKIMNFQKLTTIIFDNNSFRNLLSLQIENNSVLTSFTIKDYTSNVDTLSYHLGTFCNVDSIIFSSIYFFSHISLELPSLKSIQFGSYSCSHTKSLTFTSPCLSNYSIIDLPVLNTFTVGKYALFYLEKLVIKSICFILNYHKVFLLLIFHIQKE